MDYTINHFSISLPRGDGQDSVPELLRHLAKEVEKESVTKVADIVFHNEIDDDGEYWPHFTVYYDR